MITTVSAPPITKAPYLFVAAAMLAACATLPASAAQVIHLRGIVLGTTPESLDIGVANGDDVHLEMAREPSVAIAEPGSARDLGIGAHVSIIQSDDASDSRLVGVVAFRTDVRFLHDGNDAWDASRGARITTGRVVATDQRKTRIEIVVAYAASKRRFEVRPNVPIVSLRPGSRRAFLNPHAVFVFATPPTDGLSLVLQSAIVGDGELCLPF